VAAALQRQGRPAGGARRTGEGAAQGDLQGLGLAALGGGDAGAWRCSGGAHRRRAALDIRGWVGARTVLHFLVARRQEVMRWWQEVPGQEGGTQEGHRQGTATAAVSVRGCEGRGRAGARGKSRAGYVGSRDAMQRLGLRENL
jgi:hypothetical protein